jgi:hypothetical protein
MRKKENSVWGLCLSCERIENRLFLEAVQKAIREDRMEFEFHKQQYSLEDPSIPSRFIGHFRFVSTSQDPRLALLSLCYLKVPLLFKTLLKTFTKDPTFLTSANLLYRKHLPSRTTCSILHKIQYEYQQHFYDMPSCPCCMSRYLIGINEEKIKPREIDHILSIFHNRVLAQHPTWFIHIFGLLQTIWEQGLENRITFPMLDHSLIQANPVEFQIEFRDWMATFLETPVVIEKILSGRISDENRAFLQLWTGQTVNMPFIKRIQRARQAEWKEDLIIKTWHPDRLLTWCFDLDELSDFNDLPN